MKIAIDSAGPTMDLPFTVEVSEEVTLRVDAYDMMRRRWTATGRGTTFDGRILGQLTLAEPGYPPLLLTAPPEPFVLELTASAGDEVATVRFERATVAAGVKRVGATYLPADPVAGLLLLSGAGGMALEGQAALLASHGYATTAVTYFGGDGQSSTLTGIDIDQFGATIETLRRLVPGRRIGVAGVSRGSELALLLATRHPELSAAIAYVPSTHLHSGIGAHPGEGVLGIVDDPAWVCAGTPLPFLRPDGKTDLTVDGGVATIGDYRAQLRSADPAAAIPVERINGPVFLVGAGNDQVWPSADAVSTLSERLGDHPHQSLVYPDAGHFLSLMTPYLPSPSSVGMPGTETVMHYGGTPQADADARTDAWTHLLAFLEEWAYTG